LKQHTFRRCRTREESSKKIKESFHWGSKKLSANFQDFILFNIKENVKGVLPEFVKSNECGECSNVFHVELPNRLKTKAYKSQFGTIFAKIGGDTAHRFGDAKRGQIKLSKMLKTTTRRLKSAQTDKLRDVAGKEVKLVERARDFAACLYKRIVQVHFAMLSTRCGHDDSDSIMCAVLRSAFTTFHTPLTHRSTFPSSRPGKTVSLKTFIWTRWRMGGPS
jgi:hypothetical protein